MNEDFDHIDAFVASLEKLEGKELTEEQQIVLLGGNIPAEGNNCSCNGNDCKCQSNNCNCNTKWYC